MESALIQSRNIKTKYFPDWFVMKNATTGAVGVCRLRSFRCADCERTCSLPSTHEFYEPLRRKHVTPLATSYEQ